MYNQSMKFSAGIALLGFTFISAICGQTRPGNEFVPPQRSNLLRIISDSVIWGRNFLPAIALTEALEKGGERFIELLPEAIISGEKFGAGDNKNKDEKIRRYKQALDEAESTELYQKLSKSFGFTKIPGKTISYPMKENDSLVVGITYEGNFLFSPATKTATIFRRFGKPEKTDTRAIHGRGEERPEILTLYSYENGIILFAESDNAAEPGLLNRVFIDVPRFVRALKSEMK